MLYSHLLRDEPLDLLDPRLVAPVEGPLLDPLRPDQAGLRQDPHVLAERRLTDPKLLGQEDGADAVVHQVPVHLGPEMAARVLQPFQNLEPAVVGQRPERRFDCHIAN